MKRPTLAVWKFASCDGCQLTLLDCEDELLALAEQVEIRHFLEASSAVADGPYDVSLVEGSITTQDDIERIGRIREQSGLLVTIGACATAGGIQALRNSADVAQYTAAVYAARANLQPLVFEGAVTAGGALIRFVSGQPLPLLEAFGAPRPDRRLETAPGGGAERLVGGSA